MDDTREEALHPPRIPLLGLPIDAFTEEALIERLFEDSSDGIGGYVMTPNLDAMRGVSRDEQLMANARDADIRVADGMPLLWASRIQGTPLPARVAGSDLIVTLAAESAQREKRVYLLGGAPTTADLAAAELQERFPGLIVSGTHCPPHGFERNPEQIRAIADELVRADPDFVLVGLPFPKASAAIAELRKSLPRTWFLGLGVSFSFVCGDVLRAPRWMQRLGLEWLYRLRQEPRRLARRYLIEGPPFLMQMLAGAIAVRCLGSASPDVHA